EEPLLPPACAGKEAEGRAGVVGAIPVPEALDHRYGGVLRQAGEHPPLAELVERDHQRRQEQPGQRIGAWGRGHAVTREKSGAVVPAGAASAADTGWDALATCPRSRGWSRSCRGAFAAAGDGQNHWRSSPGPSTFDTQRPHSCGCAALPPASARWCQQRTHLGLVVGLATMRDSSP